MKKKLLNVVLYMLLTFFVLGGGRTNTASAESNNRYIYEEETFQVTYIVNAVWDENIVNATLEIENIGTEAIRNWYLGMELEGTISDIWNATVFEHVENQYVIKNATYNGNIAPGEKVSIGCVIEFSEGVQCPNDFYMPIEIKTVVPERYETNIRVVSSWEDGSEYEVSIKNNSWDTIEDWTIAFDFDGEIVSLWNGKIVEKNEGHYSITNSDYNSNIAYGEKVSFGFITGNGEEILPEDVSLTEIVSEGIKDAEKLVDESNFEKFDIVTDEYNITPLYTVDGQISAYLVEYYKGGEPTGYVIVSNEVDCLEYYIEFGTGSPNFLKNMVNMVETECKENVDRFIYMGGYTYYALVGDDLYVTPGAEPIQLTEEDIKELLLKGGETKYYEEYGYLSLDAIYAKEVGYIKRSSLVTLNVPDVLEFYTMSQTEAAYKKLKGKTITDHCGPTAGLNHLVYLDNQGFSFLPIGGLMWEQAFCTLADKMKTYEYGTTTIFHYANAMEEIVSKNPSFKVNIDINLTWEDVETYLGRSAVTFLLQDSQIYGDHFVLGVGYNTFSFSTGWTSKYIKIADGHSNQEFRYVNYDLGIKTIYAVTITR